jgi:hypothetical protein
MSQAPKAIRMVRVVNSKISGGVKRTGSGGGGTPNYVITCSQVASSAKFTDGAGQVLTLPDLYLIFWGTSWNRNLFSNVTSLHCAQNLPQYQFARDRLFPSGENAGSQSYSSWFEGDVSARVVRSVKESKAIWERSPFSLGSENASTFPSGDQSTLKHAALAVERPV